MSSSPRRAYDPRLLEGSIFRSLILLALPIMGGNVLQTAYQLIDAFWVGRLGAVGLAAVSVTVPIIFVIIAAGMGFAVAGSILVAQYAGARDHEMVDHVAAQTIMVVFVISVVLGAIGVAIAPYLIALMHVAPNVDGPAVAFLRVSLIAMPFVFVYMLFQGVLRGIGEVTMPLYILAGTVFANFCLDPVLIFGMFGVPAMGVTGAALATLLSQGGAAVVGIALLLSGRYGVHLRAVHFKPDIAFMKRALRLGYPASIEQSARSLGMAVLIFLIASFGTVTTASYGVAVNVISVVIVPAMGFSMATATLVGQNIGNNNVHRAERVAHLASLITFAVLSAVGVIVFIFAQGIVSFFAPHSPQVIAEGTKFLRIVAWSFGFVGLQFAFTGVLRASGDVMAAMIIGLITQWVLQFPLAYIMAEAMGLGTNGLWWSFPLTNVASAVIAGLWFMRGTWKTRRLIAPGTQEQRDEEAVAEQAIP